MPYVKTIKRQRKDGSIRKHYYLCRNYREAGTIKTEIIRPLTKEEAMEEQRFKELMKPSRRIHDQVEDPGRAYDQDTSRETVRKLSDLVARIDAKEDPFKKAYRPQAFAELFLKPILEGPGEEA